MLKARNEISDNADPLLAVEAIEAFHEKDTDGLTQFARQLHTLGAAQFFGVSATTVNFLTIKGMEQRIENPNDYLQSVIQYIQENGHEFSERYAVDPIALNEEVSTYLQQTLMPILNGTAALSLDFPADAPEHTRQYVLALTYVTYAFFVTAHHAVTGESELSFRELREQIEYRTQVDIGEDNLNHNPEIPFEPLTTSHLGEIQKSSFLSPAHEATSTVDITIPSRIAKIYNDGDKKSLNELVDDVSSGALDIEALLKPSLHFCRAVLIIVFNLTNALERDSYMAAAHANITKARNEGLATNRFGVEQTRLDLSTQSIMIALSSLMSNHGAFYEGQLPDPTIEGYKELLYAYLVSLGMVIDAYSVLVTGRLGLSEKEFISQLNNVLQ